MTVNNTTTLLIFSVLLLFVGAAPSDRGDSPYGNDLVVKCQQTENLASHLQSAGETGRVDPFAVDRDDNVLVRLNPETWADLQSAVPECSVAIESLRDYMEAVNKQMKATTSDCSCCSEGDDANTQEYPYCFDDSYPDYDTIIKFYKALVKEYGKGLVRMEQIGKTEKKNKIYAVEISSTPEPTYTVYVQCLIHAREWISGPVCMYLAKYLLKKLEAEDDTIVELLSQAMFAIVPVVNPDGYEYTRKDGGDRLWRKNLANVKEIKDCIGVDLNRNFDAYWSRNIVCNDNYPGKEKESEKETKAIVEYFKSLKGVVVALDFHAFSQVIIRPYSYSGDNTRGKNYQTLQNIGQEMRDQIRNIRGKVYTVGTADVTLGSTASGTCTDWFYDLQKDDKIQPATFSIELRPDRNLFNLPIRGNDWLIGMNLPYDEIIDVCKEITAGVVYLASRQVDDPLMFP